MFDHAIVYVPGASRRTDLWIDATAEYARVGTLPAQAADRLALIIRPGTSELDAHAGAALRRQPPGRNARFLPRRIRPGARRRNHRDARHHRGRIPRLVRGRRYQGAPRRAQDLHARQPIAPRNWSATITPPATDFSKPYSMSIEMKDAPVGFTDLETAAVGINVANITARLPEYFDSRARRRRGRRREARTTDVVFEPFVTEWHYRIQPPAGFPAAQAAGERCAEARSRAADRPSST